MFNDRSEFLNDCCVCDFLMSDPDFCIIVVLVVFIMYANTDVFDWEPRLMYMSLTIMMHGHIRMHLVFLPATKTTRYHICPCNLPDRILSAVDKAHCLTDCGRVSLSGLELGSRLTRPRSFARDRIWK